MGTKLYSHDLRGPPRPSPRTPWGSMDPRLRTYALGPSKNVRYNREKYLEMEH